MKSARLSPKEITFQVVLHVLVFTFYSFDKHQPQIEFRQIVYFLNFAAAAFLINYLLLPKFFYKKRYIPFFAFTLLTFAGVILVEELVLEQIYYPDTRAKRFPGVIFSLIGVLPVITMLSGFKFAWDALRKQQEVEELKEAIRESELQFLSSQINPHFLFNNLNNLYSYAIERSPQTPTIILELSSVLRYMLYECKEKFVPLSKEIEQLENFTRLSQLQIEERGQVNLRVAAIPPGFRIAPLILIVFIENAFKHSQSSQSDRIWIDIELQLSEEGRLDFVCRNNFLSTTNTDNLTQGIGLANVKKRLHLLYPKAHQLTIRERENIYEVQLSIHLTNAPLA